jgi:Raf kinase inhibitor-like YbhB/YbcL family protein
MSDPVFKSQTANTVHYKPLLISSSAFKHQEMIPQKYTCDGQNISPALEIENIPAEAKCLALIMDDPDAPMGTYVHWVVWNIPVGRHLNENKAHGMEGINDFQRPHYGGPCPPSGVHRYFFKIYALDRLLDLPSTTRKEQLETAMRDHIIAFGELIGLYTRAK